MVKPFNWMVGKTVVSVTGMEKGSDTVNFQFSDGSRACLYHEQDCCETVDIEDVAGFPEDLIGTPILQAEESSNDDTFTDNVKHWDSYTWTFYRITTMRGQVVLRWLGESNGYYSESVTFDVAEN